MEVIIVGNGPAGISAALYVARGGLQAIVLGKDGGALLKTDEIDNYYGFPERITGQQLVARGIAQAKRLGVEVYEEEVVGIGFKEEVVGAEFALKLTVKTTRRLLEADAVILATGASRAAPKLEGLVNYEGRGVSYCAICDAFFFKDMDVAVLGAGDFARQETLDLLPVVRSVTVLTNGEEPTATFPDEVKVDKRPLRSFSGGERLDTITFADGGVLCVSGVFVAIGVAGSSALAKKIGAATEGTRIVVDENRQTNIPGLFAAGDCTGGLMQIAKAVHDGAVAGMQAVKYARGKEDL